MRFVKIPLAGLLAYGCLVICLSLAYRTAMPVSVPMLFASLAGEKIDYQWKPLSEFDPQIIHAVILSEDARFCTHAGVDWQELEKQIDNQLAGVRPFGASTLTMQVTKNLFLPQSRSYIRKIIEIPMAYAIESILGKGKIIEIYLNIAQTGAHIYGMEAAAQHYFGRSAKQVTKNQAALLATSLPNPATRSPARPSSFHRSRAQRLMEKMNFEAVDMGCIGK